MWEWYNLNNLQTPPIIYVVVISWPLINPAAYSPVSQPYCTRLFKPLQLLNRTIESISE